VLLVCVCGRSCALACRGGNCHEDFTVCLAVCAGGMRLRIRYHEGFPGKSLKSTQSTLGEFHFFELFFSLQIFMVQNVFCLSCARTKRREAAMAGASSFINENILSISADKTRCLAPHLSVFSMSSTTAMTAAF